MATGGLQRVLDQGQLDFNYQQFLENRDWSVTNLQPLLNAIAAAKGANMTTTTTGPQLGNQPAISYACSSAKPVSSEPWMI